MKKVCLLILVITFFVLLCSCQSKEAKWQEQYDLGVRYLSESNYEEAVIAFTAAIEIDENLAPAYVGRGEAYMGLGNYVEAAVDFQAAIERDPENSDYYRKLSDAYLSAGDIDAAIDILEEGYQATGDSALQERIEALSRSGIVQGSVFDWNENTSIANATMLFDNAEENEMDFTFKTDGSGALSSKVLPGEYVINVAADGYLPVTLNQEVSANSKVSLGTIYLLHEQENGTGILSGAVFDQDGKLEIAGAEVWAVSINPSSESEHVLTSEDGHYLLEDLPVGYYTIYASCEGYKSGELQCVVSAKREGTWDLQLVADHSHSWEAATYFSPRVCSVCGKTSGEPLTPWGETINTEDKNYINYTIMEVGEKYQLEGIYFPDKAGDGEKYALDVEVLNYRKFEEGNGYAALDGYEWREVTIKISDSDAVGMHYFIIPAGCIDFYSGLQKSDLTPSSIPPYDVRYLGPHDYSFIVDNYESELSCTGRCEIEGDIMSYVEYNGEETVRIAARLPIEYDGAICGLEPIYGLGKWLFRFD